MRYCHLKLSRNFFMQSLLHYGAPRFRFQVEMFQINTLAQSYLKKLKFIIFSELFSMGFILVSPLIFSCLEIIAQNQTLFYQYFDSFED